MEDDRFNSVKPTGKIPRSNDKAFEINELSMREFEAFMILLMHEGEEQSTLKRLIDLEFDYKSSTKAYDHINNLCRNKLLIENNDTGKLEIKYFKDKELKELKETTRKFTIVRRSFAFKKKPKGQTKTRIYIKSVIRKDYEKFILPTVNNLKDSLSNIIKEYVDGIKDEEKIRNKFKVYTETIIIALNDLIMDIPVKTLSSKRFQKKMYDMIWKYYRSEVLKYDIFSK